MTEAASPETPATEVKKLEVKDLLEQVRGRIDGSTPSVIEKVTATLADREVQARSDAVLATITKLEEARREVQKIKPDVNVVDAEGKALQTGFLPETAKKLKEAREKVEKLEGAVNKALNGDFGKVKEHASKG